MLTPRELAKWVAKAADDVQAIDLVVLDLTKLTRFTDFFVICSGKSDTQVQAIADSILKKVAEKNHKVIGMEGYRGGGWVLVDFGDVVAHIFYPEMRLFYGLERLWSDAKPIKMERIK